MKNIDVYHSHLYVKCNLESIYEFHFKIRTKAKMWPCPCCYCLGYLQQRADYYCDAEPHK